MVWKINKLSGPGYDMMENVIYQKTNFLFSIHNMECTEFDISSLWRVGVNIINIDRTVHDEKFCKDIMSKVATARTYNHLGYYCSLGVSLTVSIKESVEIDDGVDIVIVKDIETVGDLFAFRKKHSLGKPTMVWLASYALDDLDFLIKFSDGVILDFYDPEKVIQQYCNTLIKKCREVQKPIVLFKPQLLKAYSGKLREFLPIAKDLVDFHVDGILLDDDIGDKAVKDVYNATCAMANMEQIRGKDSDDVALYFKIRAELKLPVLPALCVAHAASMAAIHSGAPVIIVFTKSGRSARWISCAYPPCYVLAITTQPSTARRLHIYKRVIPLVYDKPSAVKWRLERKRRIQFGTNFALRIGLLSAGAKLVIMSPQGDDGYCNSFEILGLTKDNQLKLCF